MLMSLVILLIFITISVFQIPQLAKEKMTREIVIFSVFMVFTVVIAIAQINNIPIPNPLDLIAFTMKPIIKLFS